MCSSPVVLSRELSPLGTALWAAVAELCSAAHSLLEGLAASNVVLEHSHGIISCQLFRDSKAFCIRFTCPACRVQQHAQLSTSCPESSALQAQPSGQLLQSCASLGAESLEDLLQAKQCLSTYMGPTAASCLGVQKRSASGSVAQPAECSSMRSSPKVVQRAQPFRHSPLRSAAHSLLEGPAASDAVLD